MSRSGVGRAVLLGAILGVMAVSAAVIAFVLAGGRLAGESRSADDPFLLVVTGPAEDGGVVARVVCVIDPGLGGASARAIDPRTRTVVPGTSFDTLADAYPFGGSKAVAEAVARVEGTEVLPFVELSSEGLERLVPPGGVEIEVSSRMDVFTGTELKTFEPGSRSIGASEVLSLAEAVGFLGERERDVHVRRLGLAVAQAFVQRAEDVPELLADDDAETDLTEDDVRALVARLRGLEVSSAE